MVDTEEAIKLFFGKLNLYRPARAVYRALFSGDSRRRKEKLLQFYSQFVSEGDLVFDIGANVGQYAEVFSSLGARVVAVEPNPECARRIRMSCPSTRVRVVEAAVGACEGTGTLKVARQSVLSSMSDEWLDVARDSKRFKGVFWASEINVQIVTIDSLSQKYGNPKFIKIDVEGYEELALKGMSRQPDILSFEFNTEFLELAFRCINSPSISPLSQFNYVLGDPQRLALETYVNRPEIDKCLIQLGEMNTFGDLIVRLGLPVPQTPS